MTRAATKNILIYIYTRQHALDFDHPIKLENFKLVNKSNKYEIKIVESILIHKLGPNLNDRGNSFPLSILQ